MYDFQKLEQIVVEQAGKQSIFFSTDSQQPGMGDIVPRLEEGARSSTSSLLTSGISLSQSNVMIESGGQGEARLLAIIRNLERFCQEVCSNKLLWTPEILLFFQVPNDMLPKFEQEREKYQKQRQVEIDGRKRASHRTGSYADLNSYIIDEEQDFEAAGETGSID